MTEEKSKTVVVSEGKRFREIIKDGRTIHQEKDGSGSWVKRFSNKDYSVQEQRE